VEEQLKLIGTCQSYRNMNSNAWLSNPETRILFLFARCRATQPRCGAASTARRNSAATSALLLLPPPLRLLLMLLCIANLHIKN